MRNLLNLIVQIYNPHIKLDWLHIPYYIYLIFEYDVPPSSLWCLYFFSSRYSEIRSSSLTICEKMSTLLPFCLHLSNNLSSSHSLPVVRDGQDPNKRPLSILKKRNKNWKKIKIKKWRYQTGFRGFEWLNGLDYNGFNSPLPLTRSGSLRSGTTCVPASRGIVSSQWLQHFFSSIRMFIKLPWLPGGWGKCKIWGKRLLLKPIVQLLLTERTLVLSVQSFEVLGQDPLVILLLSSSHVHS